MNIEVEVNYKTLNTITGEVKINTEYFKAWDEQGSYTQFFEEGSVDSLALMIPTVNVCSIRINRY